MCIIGSSFFDALKFSSNMLLFNFTSLTVVDYIITFFLPNLDYLQGYYLPVMGPLKLWNKRAFSSCTMNCAWREAIFISTEIQYEVGCESYTYFTN